jgi:uncharacterized protein DUF4349
VSHARIGELLPWYVNGTLGLGDRQAAALEVASCDECAKDVETLTKIQAAMLELEATAPEPSGYGLTRALAAVDEAEEKKRLGHPWFGWWWALTPFRRALAVSSVLGALVVLGIFIAPRHALGPVAYEAPPVTPISLDSVALRGGPTRAATNEAAPVPLPATAKTAESGVPTLQSEQIARTGSVSLLVPDVESAIAKIGAAARAQGGEVLSMNDDTPSQPGVRHTAQLQVGVPVGRFDQAMDAIARLGGLQSRSVSAENVASQIVDSEARLRNLRSTEADLLRIMSRSGKIDEVLQVENQVSATREQIEQLEGSVSALKHRVAIATVAVDVEDEAPASPVDVGIGARLDGIWSAAVASMKDFTVAVVGMLLWAVAFGPYIVGVALIGGLVSLRWRRV